MKTWTAVVSLGVIAGFAGSAVADNDHRHGNNNGNNTHQRVFRTQLVGYNEVPSISTAARGQFYAVVNQAGDEIRYWLSYEDLSANPIMSHIHLGQHHTNGGIVVWLCGSASNPGPAGTQGCEAALSTTTPITGVITRNEVISPAPNNQGIAPGDFDEVLAAMRAGVAYVNVHTSNFPGGEIRGQVN